MNFTDQYVPQSAEEWKSWLAKQEATNVDVYLKQPQRLIQDFNSENETTKDYLGREVYELLQNSNDAAAEADIRGKVYIDLCKDYLLIANTGEPFSIGGVNSLLFSHISPKKKRKNLIGQKGLGFRSILNWCKQPSIFSGHLSLAYLDSKRIEILNKIVRENPNIGELVQREQTSSEELIVPILPFPSYVNEQEMAGVELYQKMLQCRRDSFDTVVGIPFDRADYYDEAKKQLYSLDSAILLFVGSLDEIYIRIDGEVHRHWKIVERDHLNQTVTLRWQNSQEVVWNIFRKTGSIEKKRIGPGAGAENNDYGIVIAIPRNQDIKPSTPLFSFFPLEMKFPYPFFCHVTLELETNRKHPRPSSTNREIFNELAKFLVEIAARQDVREDVWSRVKLLSKNDELDKFLNDFEFETQLINESRKLPLIPTRAGVHVSADETARINASSVDWLPIEQFGDIALVPINEPVNRFYDLLGVRTLPSEDFANCLNLVKFQDVDSRAGLIVNLVRYNLVPTAPVPELLIDQAGRKITASGRSFLQSREQQNFQLPAWLNIQFIQEDLRNRLMELFELTEVRELRVKLSPFGVNEYSLASIAAAVIAETNKRIAARPELTAETHRDVIYTFFYLYEGRGDASLPERLSVPLFTKARSYVSARELYFSESYSGNGDWLAVLYESTPEKLLASAADLEIDGTDERYLSFLKWLGVADLPRVTRIETLEQAYVDHVIDTLPFDSGGVILEDYTCNSRWSLGAPRIEYAFSIDSVEKFVKADAAAILVWLAVDTRCSQWRVNDSTFASFSAIPGSAYKRRKYSGPLPHHAKWVIENAAWLIVADGVKKKPVECMLAERSLEKIFPTPALYQHPLLDRYIKDPVMFRRALENAGVIPDLTYLSRKEIEKILLSLPEKDPSGLNAKTLYLSIMNRVDTNLLGWEKPPSEFARKGLMWGKGPDGAKYYPVQDLRHADSEDFPEILTSRIKIVDLPKRRGNQQIRRIFGVEPLDKRKIIYSAITPVEREECHDLRVQFDRIKPYLLALRQSKSQKSGEFVGLKALKLVTCQELHVRLTYETTTIETDFEISFTWLIKDDCAYILVPDGERAAFRAAMFADSLGQIVATTFNIESGGDFARLVQCDESDRMELLRRMLGESEMPDIDDLTRQLGLVDTILPPIILPLLPETGDELGAKPNTPEKSEGPANPESQPKEIPAPINPDSLGVNPETHVPAPSSQKRPIVGRRTPVDTGGMGTVHRITDSNRCEELAEAFEEHENRFPIRVSGVVGYKGPKCDILSFESEADRDRFVAYPTQEKDINDVARFIEVKGSVNEKGSINLKGNELAAARDYAERYYIYRVYEKTLNDYYFLVLADPIHKRETLEEIIEVVPERAIEASRYHVEINIQDTERL